MSYRLTVTLKSAHGKPEYLKKNGKIHNKGLKNVPLLIEKAVRFHLFLWDLGYNTKDIPIIETAHTKPKGYNSN